VKDGEDGQAIAVDAIGSDIRSAPYDQFAGSGSRPGWRRWGCEINGPRKEKSKLAPLFLRVCRYNPENPNPKGAGTLSQKQNQEQNILDRFHPPSRVGATRAKQRFGTVLLDNAFSLTEGHPTKQGLKRDSSTALGMTGKVKGTGLKTGHYEVELNRQHSRAMAQSSWARMMRTRTFDCAAAISESKETDEFF